MIHINLLPIKEIRKKLRRRRQAFTFLASIVGVLVILGGATLFLELKTSRLEAEVQELQQQRASYIAIQREIEALKRKREELEARITAINSLRASSQLPVRLLDEISNRTPSERMWLNSLRITGNSVTIAGIGLDNPTIAQYMQALERSSYFGSANLASSSQTQVGDQKLKAFSMAVPVTPPPARPEGDEAPKEAAE
ncbi:PilN domain-containing protein [Desulfurivibrio sp. C05AmB]|jgi:type IV pilus assembly protein PilN|uniref:PilN domain-containing protein n=1 Tax=Desulfurivibrio sp. C05AmB TaxID=3374371 RepID=UPI00376F2CFD